MRNRTLVCIVSLTILLTLSDAGSQSILDLQRIEASKTRRRAQEIKIPEWTNRSVAPRRSEVIERLSASHGNPISSRDNNILDSARIEWVRYLNSESLPGTAVANDVAVDAAGNVYVTGKSESAEKALDIMTMKYDAFGDLLWTARYDGPVHGIDIGNAIAVDPTGNVFVTGLSVGEDSSGYDYLTIKYNNAGVEQWVARYNGPANSSDGAVALELDDDGNVYVAGSSAGSFHGWASRYDYATIKYGPSGTELWVARYNGPLEWGEDKATALALDQWGNVYVTGSSQDTVGRYPWGGTIDERHYTTIKYTPQGVAAWVRRYDTPDTADAIPTSIAVDDSGNVIVTGTSVETYYPFHVPKIVTVKYAPQGNEQWTAAHATRADWRSRSTDVGVDRDGNVYVVGVTRGTELDSLVTIKYLASGTEQWAAGFIGPFNTMNVAGVALDLVGNVYVAASKGQWGSDGFVGTEMLTLKYRNDGLLEWNRTYAAPGATSNRANAIAVYAPSESETDIIVAGGGGSLGFSTVSYDAAGSQRWAGQTGGERLCMDYVLHTEIDDQGSIYIVGEAQGLNSRVDYVVAKYNSAGVQMWSSRFNNPGEFAGNISDMAVDVNGNVYLCGWVYDYTTLRDYVTVKFNAAGEQEWVARYSAQAGAYDDMAMAIDVDANGNSYVTGLGSSGSGWKMTTVRYDPAGNEVWVTRSNDPGSGWDILVDEAGFFYVGGVTSPPEFMPCFTVIKYDLEGTVLWVARDSSWSGSDVPRKIAVDDSGNVYLTSFWTTTKFDNAGRFLCYFPAGGLDIFFDAHQGVYILSAYGDITKYTTNGVYQWRYQRNIARHPSAAIDSEGNMLVFALEVTYTSVLPKLVCVSPFGQERWATVYPVNGDEDVFAGGVEVDGAGNVYIACETGLGGSSRITLVKYNQVVVSVNEAPQPAPVSFGLSQNYPNPFNPSTKIQFSLPRSGMVTLKIYNTLGEEVASLLEGERATGVYTLEWNANGFASGMYFYQLKAGEYTETKKLLLLK